jgi:nucleotide-binding universal stress UspA family protein
VKKTRAFLQVNATAAVVEGDAKEALCQAAEQMQAALLVLGSRGLGRIKRYQRDWTNS